MSMLISLAIIASTIRTFTLDTVKSIMVAYSKCITQNLNTLIVEHSDTANTSYFYILSNLLHTIREQNSDIVDISILKIYIVKNNDINKIIAISNSYENNSDYHIEFKNLTVSEKENVKRALS
jgi:recombinational DNA repair protein RecR